jgi:RNA polymerase sigma-70 factor (ECF subfamily)
MGNGMMAPCVDEIVKKVLEGDIDAFEEIIGRYERDVRRIAGALFQNRQTTEDLVQEVFVSAFSHLGRYRMGEDFGVWLRGIARNLVRTELRNRSRETRRLQLYRDQLADRLKDDQAAEQHHARMAEAHEKCREKLPAHSLEVLELHYGRSLNLQEVASRLGRSLEAVKQLLYRVRLLLRDCIEKKMVQT